MSDLVIESEYYEKLNTFYSEEDTKLIINKFSVYYQENESIMFKENIKSLIITLINNLYTDNKFNKNKNVDIININNLDDYINQTPQERCPKLWDDIIKKTEFIEEKKNNIYTTDIYECFKCHKRKCTIEIIQTRSAYKPATTFVNCIVFGNHWTT